MGVCHYRTIEYLKDPEATKILKQSRGQITILIKLIGDLKKFYEAALLKAT